MAQPVGQTTEIEVNGVLFRIPRDYFPVSTEVLKEGKKPDRSFWLDKGSLKGNYIGFGFWLSDSKPLWNGWRSLPHQQLVGSRVFWPPEPGRPYLTPDDFFVRVVDLYPRDANAALEGQKAVRGGEFGPNRTVEEYGQLKCGIDKSNPSPILCRNPIADDPAVYISGGAPIRSADGAFVAMRMYFYSRADGLQARVDFPGHGLPRWEEIVCKTLSLVRTWRVSPGPPPGDCTKLPRLSRR
jgi:hypothetical protein